MFKSCLLYTSKDILKSSLNLKEEQISDLYIAGGMTNANYHVAIDGKEYILRIPGACTETMISRENEKHNSILASNIGINPKTLYFNEKTGVKVTDFISNAETLNGKTARLEMNIKLTTKIIKELHNSSLKLYSTFDCFEEYEKYKKLIEDANASYYDGFPEMERFFYRLKTDLSRLGIHYCPCHNDLVPENFVKDASGRLYLIDWEYSGYNDPMWDLASHLLECEFSPSEEELFLNYYFNGTVSKSAPTSAALV